MKLMRMRIDCLNADLEREKAKNEESMGKIVSDMADEMVSHVSRSDLEVLIENFLMKKGLIPDLSCKGDELLKKIDDDQNDDPDAAEGDNQARHLSGDMSKALVVFKGESSKVDGSSKTVQEADGTEVETGVTEDQIDALKDLDDISDNDDVLEEGEIVSEEEAYWKEVDEVILPSISSHYVDEEAANKGINLDEVRAETDKIIDESGSTSQQQEINDPVDESQEDWIIKLMEAKAKPPKPTV